MLRIFLFSLAFTSSIFAQEKSEVVFTPYLNKKMISNTSYIYCGSSTLMWQSFAGYLGEKPKAKSKTVSKLNDELIFKPCLEDMFWVAGTGRYSDNIVDSINVQLDRKFDKDWAPNVSSENPLLSYAHLEKNIVYEKPLPDHFSQRAFAGDNIVDYFGIDFDDPKSKRNDVLVYDYKNQNDFIVQVKTKDSLDEVYFAKIPIQSNLFDQYSTVLKRVGMGNVEQFSGNDLLQIPFIELDTVYPYRELEGLNYKNVKIPVGGVPMSVQQSIQFEINERGMSLVSTMAQIMEFAAFEITEPRALLFNEPFLIVMKRKHAEQPYFLYWVNGAEFMQRYELKKRDIEQHEHRLIGKWVYSTKNTSAIEFNFFRDGTYTTVRSGIDDKGSWSLSEDGKHLNLSYYTKSKQSRLETLNWKLNDLSSEGFEAEFNGAKLKFKRQ